LLAFHHPSAPVDQYKRYPTIYFSLFISHRILSLRGSVFIPPQVFIKGPLIIFSALGSSERLSVQAQTIMINLSPSRTLVTSFNPKTTTASQLNARLHGQDADFFEEGDWVLCVTSSPHGSSQALPWLACGLSNGEIQVHDQNRLHGLQTYNHDALVTDLVNDVSNPNALIASAADGTVTIFDIRQAHRPAFQAKLARPDEEALSVSMGFDGGIAAVGTNKSKIHFFDVRNAGGILGSYSQAHTDEITRVRFQTTTAPGIMTTSTTTTSTLVSAGEDGLVVVYDTSQPSEEAAIQNVLSVQSAVREVGFFGPQSDGIYCLTGSESLLLYHKDDSVCRKDFGPNLRNDLAHQILGSSANNHNNHNECPSPIEYLVDCHWDMNRQELQLLAGNSRGDCAIYNVGDQGISLRNRMQGGHRGVVRAWNHLSSSVFVTVGEDARLCEWNQVSNSFGVMTPTVPARQPTVLVATTGSSTSTSATKRKDPGQLSRPGGGKMRRPRSRMTAQPY
jgi:WD40 repeat protein